MWVIRCLHLLFLRTCVSAIRRMESIASEQKFSLCVQCLTSLLGSITQVSCSVSFRSPENAPAQTMPLVMLVSSSVGIG